MTVTTVMRGPVVAIGGNVDLFPEEPIFVRIGDLLKKSHSERKGRPRIVIIPSASDNPVSSGKKYSYVFQNLGIDVDVLTPLKRKEASDPKIVATAERANGFFFAGGNQLRLTSIVGGTPLMEAIFSRFLEGALVAGTSAGAAALTETMIAYGESYEALLKGKVELSPGFGFIGGAVIDTHVLTRGRFPRLVHVVSENPYILGVGLAEDTAVVWDFDKASFEVLGTRNVVVVDGRDIDATNIPEIEHSDPISVSGLRVHILGNGCTFLLDKRKAVIPERFSRAHEDF